MNLLYRQLERYINQHKKSKVWRRTVFSLACLVVFMTTYALILPAITVDEETANEMSGIAVAEANEEEPGVVLIDTAQSEEPGEQPEEPMIAEESDAELSAEENPTDVEASVPENTAVEEIELVETEDTQTLFYQGKDYTVTVNYDANAQIPEDAVLSAEEILPETPEYESYYQQALDTEGLAEINFSHFFDIKIMSNSEKVEPAAPVQISIEYADSVSIPEGKKNAIHFKDSGDVELIDAETSKNTELLESNILEEPTTAVAEGNTFTFAQDSFSVTGTVVNAAAASEPSAMTANTTNVLQPEQSITIAVGDTVELNGTKSGDKTNKWLTSQSGIVEISGSGQKVTATGKSGGTVTVTHTYKKDKKEKTEKFYITVTESQEATLTKEASGYTVTVKGNKSVLSDDVTLHVEDYLNTASDYKDYYNALVADLQQETSRTIDENSFDFLKMYHIYLTKKGVQGEYVPEKNVNLQITITYDQAPANWDKVNWVGHYKKTNGTVSREAISDTANATNPSIGLKQIKVSGKSITFHIQSFSVFPVAALAANSGGSTPVTDTHRQTANDDVRIRKWAEATNVENEFLVHLEIDTTSVTQRVDTYLSTKGYAEYVAGASEHFATDPNGGSGAGTTAGHFATKVGGSEKGLTIGGSGTENKEYHIKIVYKGETIGTANIIMEVSNGCLYLKLGDKKYINLTVLKKNDTVNAEYINVTLTEEAYRELVSTVEKTVKTEGLSVTDTMGPAVVYLDSATGDGTVSPTTASNTPGTTITWTPKIKSNLTGTQDPSDSSKKWYNNAAELTYRVRLDVTDSDFKAGGSAIGTGKPLVENNVSQITSDLNAANTQATLTYNGNQTIDFPVPYLRGTTYTFRFKKVDEKDNSKALTGAEFKLKDNSGKYTKKEWTATDNGNGTYAFTGIPEGTNFTLTETKAPDQYEITFNNLTINKIGYMDFPSFNKYISGSEYNYLGVYKDGQWQSANSVADQTSNWLITNKKKALNVILRKTDQSGYVGNNTKYLAGAIFKITKEGDTSWQGTLKTSDTNGYLTSTAGIALEDGTYYLTETTPPTGYVAKNFKLTVNSATPSVTLSIKGENGEYTDIDKNKSVVFNDDNTTATVYVTNNPAATLPSTGGAGTLPYTLGGFALIAFSALMYGCRMRRKRERRSM